MPVEIEDTTLNCGEKIKTYIDTISKKPKLGVNYFLLMDDKTFILSGKRLAMLPQEYYKLLGREDFLVFVNPALRKVQYYAFDIEDTYEQSRCNEEEGEMEWDRVEFSIYSFLVKNLKELTTDAFPHHTPLKATSKEDDDDYHDMYFGGYDHHTTINQDWNAQYKDREAFNDKMYAFIKNGKISLAVDIVMEDLSKMCEDGKFDSLDSILRLADFGKLNIPLMLGFLEATKEYKDKLRERKEFVGKVKEHLNKLGAKGELFLWELEAA